MIRIAVIIGSTRPGRRAEAVARRVADTSVRHPARRPTPRCQNLVTGVKATPGEQEWTRERTM